MSEGTAKLMLSTRLWESQKMVLAFCFFNWGLIKWPFKRGDCLIQITFKTYLSVRVFSFGSYIWKNKQQSQWSALPQKTITLNKSKKGLPLETKNKQNHENRRLGLIESLLMQHCNLRSCIRPLAPPLAVFDFQNSQDGLNNPKG